MYLLVEHGRLGEFQQCDVVGVSLRFVIAWMSNHFDNLDVLFCTDCVDAPVSSKSLEESQMVSNVESILATSFLVKNLLPTI